ncbi:MAG TPA: hypothetical protein VIC82_08295 [Candidatus Nanopelagicales bacterium]
MVAPFAQALPVLGGRGSTADMVPDMVEVPDRGIAPGGATHAVTGEQEASQSTLNSRREYSIATNEDLSGVA